MKCEEMLAALNEYVDGDLDPAICQSFQQHLEGCNPCQIVIDNIRGTIQLFQDGKPYEMPPEFHQKLGGLLRRRWKEKFPSSE